MSRAPAKPEWLRWLIAVSKNKHSPAGPLPPISLLTGQDMHALGAVAACWQLAAHDIDAEQGALAAVRAILPAMQREARPFARELIAWALDWGFREKYWPQVGDAGTPDSSVHFEVEELDQVNAGRAVWAVSDECLDTWTDAEQAARERAAKTPLKSARVVEVTRRVLATRGEGPQLDEEGDAIEAFFDAAGPDPV